MLTAVSPIDGRYAAQTAVLADYFSEYALIQYRVQVEVEYLIALADAGLPQLPKFSHSDKSVLRELYEAFTLADAEAVKTTERTTNHDVKAVEYFLKTQLEAVGLSHYREWVHFGLTSQDINNTAQPLALRAYLREHYIPAIERTIARLTTISDDWANVPMLARTHGQPASPTRLGKEFRVFVERLEVQLSSLKAVPMGAKFGGATGNFNAHHAAFPSVDWVAFGNGFVASLGLQRQQYTTQIEHYDNLAALLQAAERINTILLDLCRDIWTYISLDYFKQTTVAGEVGSSAMPHKVNPIDFENAEGNIGIANALFAHLAAKLPVSRLQRDLTDSTVLRNLGVPFAHTAIAINSLGRGLGKIRLNNAALERDLDGAWAVVAEGIQTILRREGYAQPYEALKNLTRGRDHITKTDMHTFIDTLAVSDAVREELKRLSPHNYLGV